MTAFGRLLKRKTRHRFALNFSFKKRKKPLAKTLRCETIRQGLFAGLSYEGA